MNKTPNILFSIDTMDCGGVAKSLLSLLGPIDNRSVKVTLLFDKKKGSFTKFIPKWVETKELQYNSAVIEEKTLGRKAYLRKLLSRGKIVYTLKKYRSLNKENKMPYYARSLHRVRRFNEGIINTELFSDSYDLAVAYGDIHNMVLVNDRINAKRKIAFLHNQLDIRPGDISQCQKLFEGFDAIYCVSKDMTDYLISHLPALKVRIHFFPHILNVDMFKDMATHSQAQWPFSGVRLLTVGRVTRQKGSDIIPDIALRLRNDGIEFQWLIIGEGDSRESLIEATKKLSIDNCVKFSGVSENPYPYFATCDIYVQPSRYEGYCLTLAEARAFAKPIISTHFDGSNEQLEGGRCGMIVNFGVDSISEAIKKLVSNPSLIKKYSDAVKTQKINDCSGVDIFMEEVGKSVMQ